MSQRARGTATGKFAPPMRVSQKPATPVREGPAGGNVDEDG
jgi:hypothetical protein